MEEVELLVVEAVDDKVEGAVPAGASVAGGGVVVEVESVVNVVVDVGVVLVVETLVVVEVDVVISVIKGKHGSLLTNIWNDEVCITYIRLGTRKLGSSR